MWKEQSSHKIVRKREVNVMAMVFCRGCGKEIHESAPTCPHCGYSYSLNSKNDSIWMAVTAFVCAVLSLINWFNLPTTDEDLVTGMWIILAAGLGFGWYSLYDKRGGKVLAGISIIIAILTALIIIGYQE